MEEETKKSKVFDTNRIRKADKWYARQSADLRGAVMNGGLQYIICSNNAVVRYTYPLDVKEAADVAKQNILERAWCEFDIERKVYFEEEVKLANIYNTCKRAKRNKVDTICLCGGFYNVELLFDVLDTLSKRAGRALFLRNADGDVKFVNVRALNGEAIVYAMDSIGENEED